MKKIISLTLCVMLVLGMVITVFAEDDKLDARFLEDKGQKVFCLGDEIAVAPTADGIVQIDEYSVKVETTMDEYGRLNASTGGTWAVEWVNYYLAYDAECLYLAAEVYDPDHVPYGTFETNRKRGDQFCMYLGGMKNTGDPEGIASTLAFRFFDGNLPDTGVEGEDWFECQDEEKDFFGSVVSGEYYDVNTATRERKVDHNDETNVTTYEIAVKWDFIKGVWSHVENKQYEFLTFGATICDSSNELVADGTMGHRTGIRNWGITGEVAEEVYKVLAEQYASAAFYGHQGEKTIPNMIYFGTRNEYNSFKNRVLGLNSEDIVLEDDINLSVNADYNANKLESAISVNISWDIPTFVYNVDYLWNESTLTNEIVRDGWSEDPAKITITNRSDNDIKASFSFSATVDNSEIVGKFTSDNAGNDEITYMILESAETNNVAIRKNVYFFIVDGVLPETHVNGETIGNITISISKS